nr:GntR family transcriptional regulator [Terrimicrobiaceae bacterium]
MSPVPLFRKASRSEQIAEGLRASIRQGIWKNHLPPERTLCEQVGTSRPTLRQAIHLLEKDGIVRTRAGALTEIQIRSHPLRTAKRPAHAILLTGLPSYASSQTVLSMLDEIRRELSRRGCAYEFLLDQRVSRANPGPALQKLVGQYGADCWILASVPHAVQSWFQTRGLRSVVLGSTFDAIRMPSIDADHRAVARHAVGVCARLGHRRLAYLQRHDRTAGEDLALAGLREALAAGPSISCSIAPHSGDLQGLQSRMKDLFRGPIPPTALLVSHALDTLAAFLWLLRAGRRIPQDVSVLTLRHEDMLSVLTPASSHYEMN